MFVIWELHKMKQYTIISSFPNICKDLQMTFAVWTPALCSQLHCACPWDASLLQSRLHPATFAVSSSEMLSLVRGTPHMARGQPWGLSPRGELDKCFVLPRTWGWAMSWADIAFSGCLGSSKHVFIGRTEHSIARVWREGALQPPCSQVLPDNHGKLGQLLTCCHRTHPMCLLTALTLAVWLDLQRNK